jgi:8-oxo-dGTP pyrophosphatase MutT (NUDIX family)
MLFRDFGQTEVQHDGVSPITWRMTVYVLAQRDRKILLTEPTFVQRQERPSGEVDAHEPLFEGARREVWEETGYRLTSLSQTPLHFEEVFFYETNTRRYRHAIIAIFAGQVEAEADPAWRPLPDEIKRVAWIDPASLSSNNIPIHQWPALAKAGLVGMQPGSRDNGAR